jgi:hypothetical protein
MNILTVNNDKGSLWEHNLYTTIAECINIIKYK